MRAHVIITTHTPVHLGATLRGVCSQTSTPSTVVVACDNDKPEVRAEAEANVGGEVVFVARSFAGVARRAQTRNNGVRALMRRGSLTRDDLLIFLDGDTVPAGTLVADYLLASKDGDLLLGGRYNLTPDQTEQAARTGGYASLELAREQRADVKRRAARARRQLLIRRLGFGKPHKPKLLSCNFAVRADLYLAVNGHDEKYEGWGQEDDDLGRRLYAIGARPVVCIDRVVAYHQWHESAARRWEECPNVPRLESPMPARCVFGVDHPVPQEEVRIDVLTSGEGDS